MRNTRTNLKRTIYLLAFTFLTIISSQSCVDSIPIPTPEVGAMLVFESDINRTTGFSAKISTSANLNDVSTISYPTDLLVEIETDDFENDFVLDYHQSCMCYRDTRSPQAAERYIVRASSPKTDIESIESRMVFPVVTSALDLTVSREVELDNSTTVKTNITLEKTGSSSNYFHIVPYRKIDGTSNIEYLELIDFDNGSIEIMSHYYKPGFLVNFNDENISLNTLNLTLHTSTIIDYSSVDAFPEVFFEIRSVTESYFEYERFMSNTIEGEQGGIVEQPTYSGNIINGLGYFGGYNSTTESATFE